MHARQLKPAFHYPANQRESPRRLIRLEATEGHVTIHNISERGVLLASSRSLRVGEPVELALPGQETHLATVVWTQGRLAGCRFDPPIPTSAVSAALLRAPFVPAAPYGQREPSRSAVANAALVAGLAMAFWAMLIGAYLLLG